MTRNRLEEIRSRHAAITGGEWLPCAPIGLIASDLTGEEHPTFICDMRKRPRGMKAGKADADRKFIMNAPEDIGHLLQIIDRLVVLRDSNK